MNKLFTFEIQDRQGAARNAIFTTPHGPLKTPLFAPVGTQATVKGLTPAQLETTNSTLVLANTYHLYLRPGADLVADMGGLHNFMQWQYPMLTDSGGFQVFSLAAMRKIDDDGVTFRSHIDGSTHRFTPEKSIEIQEKLGADIIMAFDECAAPYDFEYNQLAIRRTHVWVNRSRNAHTRADQALFGIVQGGVFPQLRQESAAFIANLDLPGIAIGGLSVGEKKTEMYAMIEVVNSVLPEEKPRYLMGVGAPEDIVNGVLRGIDIFDCVLPTRLARHSAALTMHGRLNLMNAKFAHDMQPIEPDCTCYTCQTFSRAYIRHLIVARELLSGTLISIHNIHMLQRLMSELRMAIQNGNLDQYASSFLSNYEYKPGKTADTIFHELME